MELEVVVVPVDTRRSGSVALVLGALFLAATAFTYVLSLSEAVNPPHWARVAGLVWLPVGLAGVPIAYVLAHPGTGRTRARVGLALGAVGVVAFVVLLVVVG
jgi:hypothetical protein